MILFKTFVFCLYFGNRFGDMCHILHFKKLFLDYKIHYKQFGVNNFTDKSKTQN